jgi:hypothetical protein
MLTLPLRPSTTLAKATHDSSSADRKDNENSEPKQGDGVQKEHKNEERTETTIPLRGLERETDKPQSTIEPPNKPPPLQTPLPSQTPKDKTTNTQSDLKNPKRHDRTTSITNLITMTLK